MSEGMTIENQGAVSKKESHISRREFMKIFALANLAFYSWLAGCTPQEIQATFTPDGGGTGFGVPVEPTSEATEASVTAPESFTSQKEILEANGYVVNKNQAGEWAVFNQATSTEIITAKDANTLTYQTQEGEEIEASAETFKVQEVAGVDVKAILTFESSSGQVDYFFLNHKDEITNKEYRYWVTPIEMQTNPEVSENYTPIEIEDVWSGRLLYSELLTAESFPEGTLIPDGMYYYALGGSYKGQIFSSYYKLDSEGSMEDTIDFINVNNDFQKWVSFYKSQTPSGVDVIIATEQTLSPDGKSSMFLHYVFGPEWPWDRNYKDPRWSQFNPEGKVNLIDSLFLARYQEYAKNGFPKFTYNPTISFETNNDFEDNLLTILRGDKRPEVAGKELYSLTQNNPMLIMSDELVSSFESSPDTIIVASDEASKLQYMNLLFMGGSPGNPFWDLYFGANK